MGSKTNNNAHAETCFWITAITALDLFSWRLPATSEAAKAKAGAKAGDESAPVSALENKSQSVVSAALEAPAASPYKMSEESFKY